MFRKKTQQHHQQQNHIIIANISSIIKGLSQRGREDLIPNMWKRNPVVSILNNDGDNALQEVQLVSPVYSYLIEKRCRTYLSTAINIDIS